MAKWNIRGERKDGVMKHTDTDVQDTRQRSRAYLVAQQFDVADLDKVRNRVCVLVVETLPG
jgi:hypothetical protein